jgi:hypothetical protein
MVRHRRYMGVVLAIALALPGFEYCHHDPGGQENFNENLDLIGGVNI